MCGIIGYTGSSKVRDILIKGLAQLEYRGYDSAGIALLDEESQSVHIKKTVGRVSDLERLCSGSEDQATCGIGHTRWATHGGVTDANAHPHQFGKVTLTHNGIIENYQFLIEKYDVRPMLKSETDSEVAAAVINHYYQGNPEEAIKKAIQEFEGTFALCILFEDHPGKIFAIRNVSPMVAAYCEQGAFLASDITALVAYSRQYFVVPEYHLMTLDKSGISLFDLEGNQVNPEYLEINWTVEAAGKNGYPFYMEKEILEQPKVIMDTILPRIKNGLPDFSVDQVPDEVLKKCKRICVVACGTAMHAGLVGKSMIQSVVKMPVQVEIASEFRYDEPMVDEETLVIVISQSGETVDTLEALRLAKRCKATTLSIVNVKGSTIARESDYVIYTYAGPEIAVASTKAYTVQISVLYLIGCKLAMINGRYIEEEAKEFIIGIRNMVDSLDKVLEKRDEIHRLSRKIVNAKDAFMIGRGLDYTSALEGSLKLKEITYIHSEAYAAGELKHGTIALITEGVPVITIATQKKIKAKTLSNAIEVRSRGANLIVLIKENDESIDESAWEEIIKLPALPDIFMVFPTAVALQLLAYYVSSDKGLDVDKPRNLAKSVTVE